MDFNELHKAGQLCRRREELLNDLVTISRVKEDIDKPLQDRYSDSFVTLNGVSLFADEGIIAWFDVRLKTRLKEINDELRELGVDIPEGNEYK